MKIAIIGAGITGLSAGYFLIQKGHQVTIFEKDKFIGGLASGFKVGDWCLERFYHHIFKSDKEIQSLTQVLGLKDIWFWKDCGAPIYHQGQIYPFSSPWDLLQFKPLSLVERFKTGAVSLFLKLTSDYHQFENKTGKEWLKKWMGEKSWRIVWEPLLKKKFGPDYEKIAMTWLWARIKKRSRFLGYPKGGFQVIINKLSQAIKKNKGRIYLNHQIKSVSEVSQFDKVIFTASNAQFLKIASALPKQYQQNLKKISYLGTVEVVLFLSKPLSDWAYWININDAKIPFVGCVQHSNLTGSQYYNKLHPVYLVAYASKDSTLFKNKTDVIVKDWIKHLASINKDFKHSWVKNFRVFKEPYTQPVFKKDTYKYIPDFATPYKNVYLANMSQIYPWDRGVNYGVEIGRRIASYI